MFDYIASILGFQGQPNSTSIEQHHGSSRPTPPLEASCQGYGPTPPRTNIRLQSDSKNSDLVRIFGFPPQEDYPKSMQYSPPAFGQEGPYIHYLLGESTASVKYVMGDDWRSKLQSDPRDSPTNSPQSQVVLRPSVKSSNTCDSRSSSKDDPTILAEERAHALRMRRCGAVAIAVEDDIDHFDTAQMNLAREYHFGWPASGGVWVLRPSSTNPEPERSADHYKTDEEIMGENLERLQRYEATCPC
ncbi:hypothetical protein Q7P35_003070 [Cladosporium inversicolor]